MNNINKHFNNISMLLAVDIAYEIKDPELIKLADKMMERYLQIALDRFDEIIVEDVEIDDSWIDIVLNQDKKYLI